MDTISKLVTLPGVTVVGKINLPTKKRKFSPKGVTLGEILKSKGISLK